MKKHILCNSLKKVWISVHFFPSTNICCFISINMCKMPSFSIYIVFCSLNTDIQKLLCALPKTQLYRSSSEKTQTKYVAEEFWGIVRISANLTYCSHLNILTDLHSNSMLM